MPYIIQRANGEFASGISSPAEKLVLDDLRNGGPLLGDLYLWDTIAGRPVGYPCWNTRVGKPAKSGYPGLGDSFLGDPRETRARKPVKVGDPFWEDPLSVPRKLPPKTKWGGTRQRTWCAEMSSRPKRPFVKSGKWPKTPSARQLSVAAEMATNAAREAEMAMPETKRALRKKAYQALIG